MRFVVAKSAPRLDLWLDFAIALALGLWCL